MIFGHPVSLKWPCISLVHPFFRKGNTNIPLQKGKTLQGTKYFDYILIFQFFHQNKAIFIFLTPCIDKMALYLLAPSFLKKKGTINAPHQKEIFFHGTKYYDRILIFQFWHQNKAILIFWTPCMVRMVFY